MKLKLIHILFAIAVLGSIYWFYNKGDATETAVAGYQTTALSIGKIESLVNSAGTLNPVVTVEVGTEISGLIVELFADFNSEVEAGQVIARIDDQTLQAQLRQNEANLSSARANLEQQNANLKIAQANLKLNLAAYERQRDLNAKGLNSRADLEAAETTYISSEAQIALAKAQVSSAKANILQSEAQLEQNNVNLERTFIRSPVTGTVIDRQVDVGQTVAASLSAPILFQIAQDLTQMQIEADVDEADIGKISEGQAVRFTVDAFPDNNFTGAVTQVRKASTITSNVVTYTVIIGANNPDQKLLPGMTANVDIILGEKDDVLRVENSALRFTPANTDIQSQRAGPDFTTGVSTAMDEMDLSDDQKKAVLDAVKALQESIARARASGEGGNPQTVISQARSKMNSALAAVLSEKQLEALSSSLPGNGRGNGGGNGGGRPTGGRQGGGQNAETTPGTLWVLEDDVPVAMRVRIGLSDDRYSEVLSRDLSEGNEVILRAQRSSN